MTFFRAIVNLRVWFYHNPYAPTEVGGHGDFNEWVDSLTLSEFIKYLETYGDE